MNTLKKNLLKILIITFFLVIEGNPFLIINLKSSIVNYQSSIIFAQARTGTDARQTIKSSGAQDGTSKITVSFLGFVKGIITDNLTGNRIPNVTVTLKQSVKTVLSSTTPDDGTFFFRAPPGNYIITASKSGFVTGIGNISVSAFETVTQNIALSVTTPTSTATTTTTTTTITITTTTTTTMVTTTTQQPKLTTLTVNPTRARRSLRLMDVTVIARDQNGKPMSGVIVGAFRSSILGVRVTPRSVTTDANGEAKFRFRFGLSSKDGIITFSAEGLTATITQGLR